MISESDIQTMESVLDGSASPDEVDRVRMLTTDPAASVAMQSLRAEHILRKGALKTLEPDDTTIERFNWRIAGAMADARATEHARGRSAIWNFSRMGSAAAACAAIGFFGGWMGRGRSPASDPVPPAIPVVQSDTSTTSLANNSMAGSDIVVPVSNEYGQVVAWQKFHNPDDARHFTEDMNRANNSTGDDRVRLMSSEKY